VNGVAYGRWLPIGWCAKCRVQRGTLLRGIDQLASEHRARTVAPCALGGESDQVADDALVNAMLAEVEVEATNVDAQGPVALLVRCEFREGWAGSGEISEAMPVFEVVGRVRRHVATAGSDSD
jgi:hypothetical protein